MPDLMLEASNDLVQRLAKESDAVRAIVELVWNSIDAESTTVTVDLERGDAGAITSVVIKDDGHGISVEEVQSAFGRIGDSWKRRTRRSKNDKRGVHGSSGQGRLRAFALGSRIRWQSTSVGVSGSMQTLAIDGARGQRNVFHWDLITPPDERLGTTFRAHNDDQRPLGALEPERAISHIASSFAPLLLNERDVRITYDGVAIDPQSEIREDVSLSAAVHSSGEDLEVVVRVIEWRSGTHRRLYFGGDDQHFTFELDGSDVESQFAFSAYVTCAALQDQAEAVQLADLAPEPINEIRRAARRLLREHFALRRRQRRREQIVSWQERGIYPYRGDPASEAEAAERAVFDVVSGTLSPHIAKQRTDAQLTLALLRDVVRHEPEKLTAILHELVALREEDRDMLLGLLSETSLPAIIKSASSVSDRSKFLAALEHMLFHPVDAKLVNERDHLHKILEKELWVFGEEYQMMSSERGLTEVLRTHLRLSGLPERDARAVRRWDGKTGRVDLHLATVKREHDRTRHLVVELKAPSVMVGRKELDQVEDYCNVLVENPQFHSDSAEWDIILVCTDMQAIAARRIHPDGLATGKFWAQAERPAGTPKVTAHVRRWRDLIDENRRRLEFFTSALTLDSSLGEGMAYVRGRYAELLPPQILEEDSA
ncbi:ATP-binding protein [Kribbella sp. GL6]|uniref:ATP-binding protein n=1 Tax=Kribbella sp. GL6 TaxID=3419765 RepID=UPI003D020904